MTSTLRPDTAPAPPTPRPRSGSRRAPLLGGLLAAVVLAAAAVAGVAPLRSPSVPGPDAVAGVSLDSLRADLAVVAAQPHPMGSPEQAAVEAYLVRQLTAMGLQPTVEEQTVTMAPEAPRSVWTGTVRTVVARVEGVGPDADQAVMLAAHHDSVTTGPGAGDNGAGVVSVLAAVRALTAAPPPRHDVVVAFVDGEEHEMLGSLAIVETAPWLHDVRVVVNTEGIGNAGRVTPALTTPDNGWALRQYLDGAPEPVVYSALGSALNAAGQGADLGRYQEVVPAGLELVGIGGLPAYHAGTDTASGMHDGTLAEYATTVVGLAQHLSQADLRSVRAPDLVVFTVVDGVTVAYLSTWSLPLAVLSVLAVVVVIALAVRRRRVRLVRVVVSWLVLGVAGLAGILTGTALWLGAKAVDPRLSDAVNGGAYERTAYVLATVAAAAGGVLLVVWPLRRRCRALEVVAGGLIGWGVVALLLAVFLPDAAYVATWPLLAATVGFGVLAFAERSAPVTLATVTVAALPAVLLVSPLVALYFVLAARLELTLSILATPLPMLWAVLALTIVIPLLLVARSRVGWRPAAVFGAAAVGLAAVGLVVSAGSAGPRPDLLVYHADADAGTARWVALPEQLDAYTGQVADTGWTPTQFEASPFHQPGDTWPASAAPAPVLAAGDLGVPAATVTGDVSSPQGRVVTLDAIAPPGTYALTIDVRSRDGVRAVAVNGKPVPEATTGTPDAVQVVAFSPRASVPVELTVPASADVELVLSSYTRGLDGSPAGALLPRPPDLTTAVHEVPDAVLVTTVVRLPA